MTTVLTGRVWKPLRPKVEICHVDSAIDPIGIQQSDGRKLRENHKISAIDSFRWQIPFAPHKIEIVGGVARRWTEKLPPC